MIWLKVPSTGTLIRALHPHLSRFQSQEWRGRSWARSCLDWDRRLSLVSELFRASLTGASFELLTNTAFLLQTASERVGWVLLLSSPGAEQPETESDPWRGREGKEGRWGAAPMSAVSVLGAVLPLLPVHPSLPCWELPGPLLSCPSPPLGHPLCMRGTSAFETALNF